MLRFISVDLQSQMAKAHQQCLGLVPPEQETHSHCLKDCTNHHQPQEPSGDQPSKSSLELLLLSIWKQEAKAGGLAGLSALCHHNMEMLM